MNKKQIKYPEFLMIDSKILKEIGNKKSALKILALIWIIRKSKAKGKAVDISKIYDESNMPKSSFYQAIKDLKKLGFVKVLKNSKLSLLIKLHQKNSEFIKLEKEQLKNWILISGNQMLVAFRIRLILKNKKPKETFKYFKLNQNKIGLGMKNWAIHLQECVGGGVKCCENKFIRYNFEEIFTFKVFKNIFECIQKIWRIIKSKSLKIFLKNFWNIDISFFRKSKNGRVKTFHSLFREQELKISR